MPLTYDQISAITEKKFIPKMVDNIFDSIPLFKRLRGKQDKLDGGDKIVQPLNYAQNSAGGWYSGAETLDTSDNEPITAAEYEWKQLYENISITRRDELRNMGDAGKINFVRSKIEIAEKTIADRLGEAVYNNYSNTKQIQGLRLAISTSNTVGGISQTDNSWWQCASLDSTTTALTVPFMQGLYGAASVGSDKPSVGMTTQAVYDDYYAQLQPQQRFTDKEMAKGGFTNLMFNGIPIMEDSKCPTGYLFFLNEKYIKLKVHKDENFRFEKFMKPVNQNIKLAKIYWMGALCYSNMRMHSGASALG